MKLEKLVVNYIFEYDCYPTNIHTSFSFILFLILLLSLDLQSLILFSLQNYTKLVLSDCHLNEQYSYVILKPS